MNRTDKTIFLKPENAFLLLAIFFGLLFIFITPPFQVPDEEGHFYYAYAISIGQFTGYQSIWPGSMMHLSDETRGVKFHPEKKIDFQNILKHVEYSLDTSNTVPSSYQAVGKYSPFPYLPQVIGIEIGKLLNLNPLDFFYFGRIFTLAVWILLGYLAIKIAPSFKWTFVLLFLTPMSLFEAGSYSADSFQNALSFLWVGTCLYYSAKNDGMSTKEKIMLGVLMGMMALMKPPYIFLLLLYLVIPRKIFGAKKQYWTFTGMVALIGLLLMGFSLSYLRNDISMTSLPQGIDLYSQLSLMLNNPINAIIVILRTFRHLGLIYLNSMIGILGWLDTVLPDYVYILYPVVFILILLVDQKKGFVFPIKQKLIFLLSMLAVIFTIAISLYLTWTPIGEKYLLGIQGRYFIPVVPAAVPIFSNKWLAAPEKIKGIAIISFVILMLAITVRTLILRYYIPS